ncbi:MAG: hypothetical protein KJ893_02930 [Candidatus Omnitrophica bacterium]|nr:hypothetical protein [Candidatus Omnitrophota bacterium]MBU4512147.1 hypothetical protein [Patescibacteria group bacterium]MCG2693223.1 hypothetical protein [Candidatus Parcubacteria bacterium]
MQIDFKDLAHQHQEELDRGADNSPGDAEEIHDSGTRPSLKKTAGFIGLVVISVGILSLGIWRLKNTIQAPFALYKKTGEGESASTPQEKELSELVALQSKDTDLDGLSDFDELYIYGTSPYIEDTDSDGYTDKEEVDSNNDPVCPTGQDCYGEAAETAGAETAIPAGTVSLPQGFSSIEQLRQVLETAGIPKETLDQIDDDSLIELYNQTIQETGTNPFVQTQDSASPEIDSETADYLNQLSPDEIRELLIQGGADPAMLEQVDDEMLMEMVKETLE